MTVTLLVGPETTIQNVDNIVRGMDAAVYELEPDAAPLTVLMNQMGTVPSGNPKFEWNEDEAMPRVTTLSASALSTATTFGSTADIWRVGDVAKFTNYAFGVLITATAAGTFSGTAIGTQVSALSTTEVFRVGNANAELATLRELKFSQLNVPYNYDQIIRTPFGVSTTDMGTQHYGGDERARLAKHFGIEHARTIESTHFFGIRSISSVTRTAGGLQYYVTTNVTNDTGGLTEAEWKTFLRTGYRYGSARKVAFCSPLAYSVVEGYGTANIAVQDNAFGQDYGFVMKSYTCAQGVVDLVMHRDWADSSVYGGYVFLVDLDAPVRERPLQNVGATQLLKNRQSPDYDGVKDEYRSETGIQVVHERRHAILTGITG